MLTSPHPPFCPLLPYQTPCDAEAAARFEQDEDTLAGGPDQWAAGRAHKPEGVRDGERDLWRTQFTTPLLASPS